MLNRLISRKAIVTASRGTQLRLRLDSSEGCGSCARKGACGSVQIPAAANSEWPLGAELAQGLVAGDQLSLAIDAADLLRMAMLCYLLPALFMLAGAGFAALAADSGGDMAGLVGAALGLIVGSLLLRLYDSRCGDSAWREQPQSAIPGTRIVLTKPE